ncbi:MAG: sulfurtransferase, partial [Gammaproteobacteria bacterium]
MFDTLIDASELNANLSEPDWVIIDCRYDLKDTAAGYRSYLNGHVPGAIYAHLHDDLSGSPDTDRGRHPLPAPGRLRDVFSGFGIDSRRQVIAYDDSWGAIAGRLWWMLRYMNHDAVAVLDGGWQAWV